MEGLGGCFFFSLTLCFWGEVFFFFKVLLDFWLSGGISELLFFSEMKGRFCQVPFPQRNIKRGIFQGEPLVFLEGDESFLKETGKRLG